MLVSCQAVVSCFLPGGGVVVLGLALDGLKQGLELVGVAGDLSLDRLAGFELGSQFLEGLRGGVRHAGGLVL